MRRLPSEREISTAEAVLLRWVSPAAGVGLAIWMVLSRWVTTEAVGLVLGLLGARLTLVRAEGSSTRDSARSGDSSQR